MRKQETQCARIVHNVTAIMKAEGISITAATKEACAAIAAGKQSADPIVKERLKQILHHKE